MEVEEEEENDDDDDDDNKYSCSYDDDCNGDTAAEMKRDFGGRLVEIKPALTRVIHPFIHPFIHCSLPGPHT